MARTESDSCTEVLCGLARKLGIKQPTLSKMESEEQEMQIDTLRRVVEALGGHLDVIAHFPNASVRLTPYSGSVAGHAERLSIYPQAPKSRRSKKSGLTDPGEISPMVKGEVSRGRLKAPGAVTRHQGEVLAKSHSAAR